MTVLDLFAGTGVGVACKGLGVDEEGVEIMPEAIATRDHHGFSTPYNDVWDSHLAEPLSFDTVWGSPPCQTFSIAGAGAGRKALNDVLGLITDRAYRDVTELRERAATLGDDRTGLVLTPLHYAFKFMPMFIALEQVPPVLPVWEAMAEHLRGMGYSVWTGYLTAEMFGVPQTRKRAFLLARRDGFRALPPVSTHSRYYPRNPAKLDPGVKKWASMAEALGFADFTAEKRMGAGMVERHGVRPGRDSSEPAFTVRASARGMEPGGFRLVGNQVPPGNARGDYHFRDSAAPAQTLTSQSAHWNIVGRGLTGRPSPTITGGGTETGGAEPIAKLDRYSTLPEGEWVGSRERLTPAEAATLQSYPTHFTAGRTRRNAPKRPIGQPATTITAGHDSGDRGFLLGDGGFYKAGVNEVATLQAYPQPFEFKGSKTKQFLQIGNAVPPLMAKAVLEALWKKGDKQ